MKKICSRCGKIHDLETKCYKGVYNKRDKADAFKYTKQWRNKSLEIRTDAKHLCEVCADKGVYTTDKLSVHHIKKARYSKDLRYDNYNLICLCIKHHYAADNPNKVAEEDRLSICYLQELAKKREEGKS